uniref:Portal protein n=1 Tax=viral metagenome TaxID=1070528 RepID=A0A6H1ZFX6_9ZZZZ
MSPGDKSLSIEELKEKKPANIQFVTNYITELRQKIGLYLPFIPEQSEAEDFFEIIENDAAVSHALNIVSLMSAGEFFELATQNEQLTKIIIKGLSYIRRFTHARKSMIQKAFLYGLSIQKKNWKKVVWRNFPGLVWEVPTSLLEVDVRRTRIERNVSDKTDIWWSIYDAETDRYIKIEDRNINPFAPVAIQDYIWTEYEREEMSPYKRGVGEILYLLVYIKNRAIQAWSELSEKWGQPFLVGQIKTAMLAYNAAAKAGSGMGDASEIMKNFVGILENMRARNVAVIPDHDAIKVHEHGNQGANILQQLIDYIDKKIQLLILGAELTTIAPSVGSYALGQAHKGITESIVNYNKAIVEEELERDLVQDFLIRNKYNLIALDIDFPEQGEIKLFLSDRRSEKEAEMQEGVAPSQHNMRELGF